MKHINNKYLAILFAVCSVLLSGTKTGFVFGLCGIIFGISILFHYKSQSYKKAAKTGCVLSFLALVLNALVLFFPETPLGQFSAITSPIHENISSFAENTVSNKGSKIIRKIDDFVSDFLPDRNVSLTDAPSSKISQEEPFSNMEVHFLDVGQGLSILVESDGHYLLYDGGDRDTSSFVVSYLQDAGVEKLDYVIASHYDADHLNGVVGALNAFPVGMVLSPDYETDTRIFQSFLNVTEEKSIPVIHPEVGSSYSLGNASFSILGPSGTHYEDYNDYSIVIMLQNGTDKFLITGDSEYTSESQMCASGADLSCSVYVAGHHGSGNILFMGFTRTGNTRMCRY